MRAFLRLTTLRRVAFATVGRVVEVGALVALVLLDDGGVAAVLADPPEQADSPTTTAAAAMTESDGRFNISESLGDRFFGTRTVRSRGGHGIRFIEPVSAEQPRGVSQNVARRPASGSLVPDLLAASSLQTARRRDLAGLRVLKVC
jgi:hypothetical protein